MSGTIRGTFVQENTIQWDREHFDEKTSRHLTLKSPVNHFPVGGPVKYPGARETDQAANRSAGPINAAGGVPGSKGPENRGASSTIRSDPQRPHRCRVEVETVSQFSQ